MLKYIIKLVPILSILIIIFGTVSFGNGNSHTVEERKDSLLRAGEEDIFIESDNDISEEEVINNRRKLSSSVAQIGDDKGDWQVADVYINTVNDYVAESITVWNIDDTAEINYDIRISYSSFNNDYICRVYVDFDVEQLDKGEVSVYYQYGFSGSEVINGNAQVDLLNLPNELSFSVSKNEGFDTKEEAEEICNVIYITALNEMEYAFCSELEYHLYEFGLLTNRTINTAVSASSDNSSADKPTCEVDGCEKEGVVEIDGFSGKKEYYCQDHYNEMEEIIQSMLNDANMAEDDGYTYDPNDPYYTANDHNHDGKISDQEFKDAMKMLLDELAAR